MPETKPEPQKGDPCPACGGELKDVRAASDDERRRALDKENPINLGPNVDLATKQQLEELGPLARCHDCGYKTRYKPETGDQRSAREASERRDQATAGGAEPTPRRSARA